MITPMTFQMFGHKHVPNICEVFMYEHLESWNRIFREIANSKFTNSKVWTNDLVRTGRKGWKVNDVS